MFEYIDYIKAVRDNGSFTKAAERLFITQPALSLAIRKAEEQLGVKLFDRKSKPVRLTEAGILYLEAAMRAQELELEIKNRIQSEENCVTGSIRIGAAGISMTYIIPEILEVFRKRYPQVRTEITEESFYTLKDLLETEEIDFMVDTETSDLSLISNRLFQNRLLYAVPESMIEQTELINRGLTSEDVASDVFLSPDAPKITMADVASIPYLSLQPRNELYSRAELIFTAYQKRPNTIMHFNQQITAYRFASRGYGATFVADTLVKFYPIDGLRYFLFDCQVPERWISISEKKNRYRTNAMKAFVAVAKEVFSQK